MNHLSDEQLSALADGGPALRAGALAGGARAAAERHLESCAACRDALAGLAAQDRDLRGALEHDPGDAYFETFAARVGGRIRAAGLRGAQARAPEGRGLAEWFRSPRKLAVVGAVATVVVGAGIVMLSTREATVPALREQALERAAGQAAPMAGAPAPPQAQPPAADADRAPAPERAMTAAPRAIQPRVEPRAVARDEAREAAGPAEREAVTAPGTQEEALSAPAPATANEVTRAPQAKAAVSSSEAKYGEGAGVALERARQSLGVAKGGTADEFSGQPTFTSLHGKNALRLTALAEVMKRAPAWDSAAEEWATVLLGTQGTPLETETRYQLARARHRAWQAGVTEKRAARAAEAFAGFLGTAPAGARRDSVEAWRAALGK